MVNPRADTERENRNKGFRCVAGIDEVGRGALAGPVVAAVAVLQYPFDIFEDMGIRDSKLLSPEKREEVNRQLLLHLSCWGIGEASVEEIDRFNIRIATFMAMKRAVESMSVFPDLLMVDGREKIPGLSCMQKPFVGGDKNILSIAAASIIAKVYRDRKMAELDGHYGGYGFSDNKGYGTPKHKEALVRQGVSQVHRTKFCQTFLTDIKTLSSSSGSRNRVC